MRTKLFERRRGEYRTRFPTHFCAGCGSVLYPEDNTCFDCDASRPGAGWVPVTDGADGLLGRVIGGRYLLTRNIGHGTSARVYRASSLNISKEFAIKLVAARRDEAFSRERVDKEIEALSGVRSPHVVTIYEVLELYNDYFALVMELAEGVRLDQLVGQEGPLPPDRALKIVRQIANGISEAHTAGLVHRDLKPENIMVERLPSGDDFVRILDLGIVYVAGDPRRTSGFLGSPLYASPEQIEGGRIDSRSDLYSLGGILHFLLSGEAPFVENTLEHVLEAHVRRPLDTSRLDAKVDIQVTRLVADLLAKKPNERPLTAQHVVERLDVLLRQQPVASLGEESSVTIYETPSRGLQSMRGRRITPAPDSLRANPHEFEVPIDLKRGLVAVDGCCFVTHVLASDSVVAAVGKHHTRYSEPIDGAACVSSSRESSSAAVGTRFGAVYIVGEDGTEKVFQEARHEAVSSVAFPDRSGVAVGTLTGCVHFVNLETRKSSRLATGSPVSAVALSPVRRQVAVARDTGLVELRNIDDGQLVSTWALSTPARSLAFSQDGYLLASVGLDNVVTLSQVVPGRGILTIAPGHELLAIRFGAGDQLVGYFRTERGLSARGLNGVKPA